MFSCSISTSFPPQVLFCQRWDDWSKSGAWWTGISWVIIPPIEKDQGDCFYHGKGFYGAVSVQSAFRNGWCLCMTKSGWEDGPITMTFFSVEVRVLDPSCRGLLRNERIRKRAVFDLRAEFALGDLISLNGTISCWFWLWIWRVLSFLFLKAEDCFRGDH